MVAGCEGVTPVTSWTDWLTVCITAVGAECSVWELWARSELSWEKILVWSTEWSSGPGSRTDGTVTILDHCFSDLLPPVKLILTRVIIKQIVREDPSVCLSPPSSLEIFHWQQLTNNERSCKCKLTTISLIQNTGHAENGVDERRGEERRAS